MDVARKVFVGLAWSFVLAVAIQFLLAASAYWAAKAWRRTGNGASSSSTSYLS